MSAKTSIQWTNRTWNPVRGCSIVSAGCTNCYAMKQAKHVDDMSHTLGKNHPPYHGLWRLAERGPIWTGKIRLVPEALEEPLRWRKPQRIFVNSMSDLFHEDVPNEFIAEVFDIMASRTANCGLRHWPHPEEDCWGGDFHTYQMLTKRPERMRDVVSRLSELAEQYLAPHALLNNVPLPLPNVWLGVSVEDQATADERIPLLLQTPAALRFLSVEPLLSPVDLHGLLGSPYRCTKCGADGAVDSQAFESCNDETIIINPERIKWVICGGESGPRARPCNIDWIRSIVRQCKAAGVACFVKQLGSAPYSAYRDEYQSGALTWKLRDSHGGDPLEWPEDLRVREFAA